MNTYKTNEKFLMLLESVTQWYSNSQILFDELVETIYYYQSNQVYRKKMFSHRHLISSKKEAIAENLSKLKDPLSLLKDMKRNGILLYHCSV